MDKPVAVFITNIPVPYRYQLYHSFCNSEEFEGWVFFDSISYGETWATQMDDGVNYEVLGGKSIRTLTGKMPINFRLLSRLKKKAPDVIVLSDFSPLVLIQALLYVVFSRKSIKLISMTDENRDFYNKLSFRWLRWLTRKIVLLFSDGCICCSEDSKEHIERLSKRMKGRTFVSYLTPEASYYEQPAAVEEKMDTVNLLTVCRLVELKRVDRVIRAVKQVDDKGDCPPWKLTIVGSGPEEAKLRELVRTLGLEHRVIFHGRLIGKDVQSIYRKSDIFVLTSNKEPWGVVVHEAMLNGLVPIVTRAVGASEIVRKGGGIVVEDRVDEQSLISTIADSIESLVRNPGQLSARRRDCMRFAHRITIDNEVAAYLSAVR